MTFEKLFGYAISLLLKIANPYKKIFVKTDCEVHIFNNMQALRLLRKYKYMEAYFLIKPFIKELNKGSVWADQNFKSTNHFYNPKTKKGMFGYSHAMNLVESYYNRAQYLYSKKQFSKAMFYLGAAIHIVQDLTIPQHVQVRLLNHHRSFENFVKYTYDLIEDYRSMEPPVLLPDVRTYLEYNARIALKVDQTYKDVLPMRVRFFKIALSCLPLAQSTSAGCMILFVKDLSR